MAFYWKVKYWFINELIQDLTFALRRGEGDKLNFKVSTNQKFKTFEENFPFNIFQLTGLELIVSSEAHLTFELFLSLSIFVFNYLFHSSDAIY